MHPAVPWFTFARTRHVSLADCLALANPHWPDDHRREVFVSKEWAPQTAFEGVLPTPHKYGLVPCEGEMPDELAQAIAFNRVMRPATLHEALLLAAHRETIPWWGDDFAVTGTHAQEGVRKICPTISTREDRIYLGTHELYTRDLPGKMLFAVQF